MDEMCDVLQKHIEFTFTFTFNLIYFFLIQITTMHVTNKR